jgi:ArsR family metal-binding transcriptional regulator
MFMKLSISYVKPCTERDRVSVVAETGEIEVAKLLGKLNGGKVFQKLRHSPELDMIRMNHDNKEIMVFGSGRIEIRKTENEMDAIKTMNVLKQVMGL